MSNKETKTINPNPPADFQPERQPFTPLKPFRYWCQKVLPLVYDDSLSYYELLCKVVDYLNKTMEDVDNFNTDMTSLYDTYEQLQEYVNNYFYSLDVQTEINNKLDSMASDGTLLSIISETVINEVDSHIDKMAGDGSLLGVIDDTVVSTTENSFNTIKNNGQLLNIMKPTIQEEASSTADEWLSSNLTDPANPPLDSSLTLKNAAANAKATGDRLSKKLGHIPQEGTVNGGSQGSYNKLSDLPNYCMALVFNDAMNHYSDTQSLGEEYLSSTFHYLVTLSSTKDDTLGEGAFTKMLLSISNKNDVEIISNSGDDKSWVIRTTLSPTDVISDNNIKLAQSGAVFDYVEQVKTDIADKIKNKNFVVVDISGKGDYNSVVEAVANEPENTVIYIKPGIYEGTIQAFNKRIILIGTDRNECILKSKNGLYEYPCVNGSCGYLENLTLYSEYEEGVSNEVDVNTTGAYAFHCENEYGAGKTLEFHHCTLISDFFPALGMGTRKDFTCIIDDCVLENRQTVSRGKYVEDGSLGALYFHDSNGEAGKSRVIVKDSILKSDLENAMCPFTLKKEGNSVTCSFINNVLYSKINKYSNNIWYRNGNPFTEEDGNFSIEIGYGNSNNDLNNN